MILATHGIIASKAAAAGGYDADAQAFFTAAGITDVTQKDAINAMVLSLKSNGFWSRIKAMYPFVGGDSTKTRYNLKDPLVYNITWYGNPGFTLDGVAGNGANAYGDTFFVDSNANFPIANRSMMYWTKNNLNSFSTLSGALLSANPGPGAQEFDRVYPNSNAVYYGGFGTNQIAIGSNLNINKFQAFTKNTSNLDFTFYSDAGTFAKTADFLVTSTNTRTWAIFKDSFQNGSYAISNAVMQFLCFADYFTPSEIATFKTIVTTFQTSLSR